MTTTSTKATTTVQVYRVYIKATREAETPASPPGCSTSFRSTSSRCS